MSELPLFRLFKRVDDPYGSIKDTLAAIGGDFEAELRDVYVPVFDSNGEISEYKKVPNYSCPTRKDTQEGLAITKDRYCVIQYAEALKFLEDLIGNREASIWAGQAVENGAKLHLIIKTPEYIQLGPEERFDCFFTISTSHDGSMSLQAMCSPIHNISQTIYTPAEGIVKIKHTARAEMKVAAARITFGKLHEYFRNFGSQIKEMTTIKLSEQEARDYFYSIFEGDATRLVNLRDKIYNIYKFSGLCINLASCRNTLFGAFMAVVQYADYYKTVRKSIRRNELDAKIEARLSGDGAKLKAESFAMALKIMRKFS